MFEAFVFILGGFYLAICANVGRRAIQTRFWMGLVAPVLALCAVPAWFVTGLVTAAAMAFALVVTVVVGRVAATREDDSLDRMRGALIGLGVFQAMLLVASLLGMYVMRSSAL